MAHTEPWSKFDNMKTYIALIVAAGLFLGCGKTSVQPASQQFNELPAAVQKTARAQAPNAEIVNVASRTENGMQIYDIQFHTESGTPTVSVAADGKLVNSDFAKTASGLERALASPGATGTKFSSLPEKAQKTIKQHAPDAEITDVTRQEKDGRVFYEVGFMDKGTKSTLRVAEDGQLIQDLQKQ